MKKLLITTDCFFPVKAGIERFLIEVIPKLKNEYDIKIIAPKNKTNKNFPKEYEGVEIIEVPFSKFSFSDFKVPRFAFKKIKEAVNNADIIFNNSIGPIGMLSIFYANKKHKKIISYIHSIEDELVADSLTSNKFLKIVIRSITKIFLKYFYNRCSLLLVPSKKIAEILKTKGIKTKKAVVPLGVDHEKFSPVMNKRDAKLKLSIEPEAIVIGYCGRIAREKDILTLYRAFLRLKKDKKIKLLLVGPALPFYEKILKKDRDVIMTGFIENVVPYLQAMDIFVLPSLTETTSLSTLEAMSCGLSIIASKVGCLPEYIKEKENGLLFPKGNSYILYRKLKWLINNDYLRKKLSKNARITAKNFSWEKTAQRLKRIFESL